MDLQPCLGFSITQPPTVDCVDQLTLLSTALPSNRILWSIYMASPDREHAKEMGSNPDKNPPFFFMKPPDAAVDVSSPGTGVIPYPPETANLHHEVEMVVALGSGGTGDGSGNGTIVH